MQGDSFDDDDDRPPPNDQNDTDEDDEAQDRSATRQTMLRRLSTFSVCTLIQPPCSWHHRTHCNSVL